MENYTFPSIIGTITVVYQGNIIDRLFIDADELSKNEPNPTILKLKRQIDEYFEGKRLTFNIPFNIEGSTFKIDILNGILAIPLGKTMSYKELAYKCGYPNAYRAVGTICKNNKLPIIIPCHRVIKSNGELGEYVFGKHVKKALIDLEESYYINWLL